MDLGVAIDKTAVASGASPIDHTYGVDVARGLHAYVIDDLKSGQLMAPFALNVQRPIGWYLNYLQETVGKPAFDQFRRWLRRETQAART